MYFSTFLSALSCVSMSSRTRYDYYAPPRHSGILPDQLRQLLVSQGMLRESLRSLERWSIELYAAREGWGLSGPVWDEGDRERFSWEEVRQEERECDELHARRSAVVRMVGHALTVAARPRRG